MNSNLLGIKKLAAKIKKSQGIPLHAALDQAAKHEGFANWSHTIHAHEYESNHADLLPTGTMVYVEPLQRDGIVVDHDARTRTISLALISGAGLVADHEVSVYKDQQRAAKFMPMRLYMPYGLWTLPDGSEVLFNRNYCPIWKRSPSGEVDNIAPELWVRYVKEQWYFREGTEPWFNRYSLEICQQVLQDWGVFDRLPLVCERYGLALRNKKSEYLDRREIVDTHWQSSTFSTARGTAPIE
jgi:hypothetical protein